MNKEQIIQYYLKSHNVKKLTDFLNDASNNHISCLGLIGSSRAYIVAATAETTGGHSFVICSDKEKAAYFYNDLENIYGEKDTDYSKKRILFYPTLNTFLGSFPEAFRKQIASDFCVLILIPHSL